MLRHRLAAAALPLLLAAAASAPARQPQRWAVVVGINDYTNFGEEPGGDLLGAENDARAMRDVLTARYSFPQDNVMLLLSGQATREAIKGAVTEWLPANVRQGDVVVFYFAGHGSLAVDDDNDEADGLDETICPADVLRNASTNDIRDDELRRWLLALPSSQVIVLLDSCHSGTATRMVGGMRPRTLLRDNRPARAVSTRGVGGTAADESMVDGSELIEIAAAAPDQSAMDATFVSDNGAHVNGGAFTTHLVRKLWQAPPTASYRDLFVNTVAALKGERFAQDPQLSGPAQRPLFTSAAQPGAPVAPAAPVPQPAATPVVATPSAGVNAVVTTAVATPVAAPDEFVVANVTGSEVAVQGGANRGLVSGTLLQAASGAQLRVGDVAVSSARGTLVRGSMSAGERLRLVEAALPSAQLRVDASSLDAALRTALDAALAEPEVAIAATAGAAADVYLLQDRAAGVLRVLGRDGVERTTVPSTIAAVTAALAPMLRNELAVARLAQLDNPASSFQVSISLAGGKSTFRVGDEISFRVKTEREGYLTLVDLAADGTLTVLYPNALMQNRRLRAGEEVMMPAPNEAAFVLTEPAGTGVVRAFITAEPLRLDVPDTANGAAIAGRIRDELLASTRLTGGAAAVAPAASWATAMVVYVVER